MITASAAASPAAEVLDAMPDLHEAAILAAELSVPAADLTRKRDIRKLNNTEA
jgi:hypothetical protein